MRTLPEVPIRPSGDVILTDGALRAAAAEIDAGAARSPAIKAAWRREEMATIPGHSPNGKVHFAPLQRGERLARRSQCRVDRERSAALGQRMGRVAFQERQVAEVVERIGRAWV